MYEERNKLIRTSLGFVWFFTILVSLLGWFLGGWRLAIVPLIIAASIIITICSVDSMEKRKSCNFWFGVCSQYSQFILIVCAYKLMYWQFAMSAWYLVAALILFPLLSLFVLWIFIKNNKPTKNTKPLNNATNIAYGALGMFIATMVGRYLRSLNLENINMFSIPILAGLLLAFAFLMTGGVRYLVLKDDKMLFKPKNGGD